MTLLTILLLAVITFTTRYLFLHPSLPVKLGPKMINFLNFSAPAVLTAIWVPIIFVHDGALNISPLDPFVLSATLAVIISAKTKNIYWTVGVSLFVFALMRIFL
jgi:branched-subunit amino acid transport protein